MKKQTVQITLELNEKSVKKIENYLEEDTLKSFLEREINDNPECFIEMLGLDNY